MIEVDEVEAQTRLGELIRHATNGGAVRIMRGGRPVAQLTVPAVPRYIGGRLSPDWCEEKVGDHIDLAAPGIYQWSVGADAIYIGKSKRLRSRLREYPNNIRKLLDALPYRRRSPDGFRLIHQEMSRAVRDKDVIVLTVLENCDAGELNARERHWINQRRAEALSGGPRVLNSN